MDGYSSLCPRRRCGLGLTATLDRYRLNDSTAARSTPATGDDGLPRGNAHEQNSLNPAARRGETRRDTPACSAACVDSDFADLGPDEESLSPTNRIGLRASRRSSDHHGERFALRRSRTVAMTAAREWTPSLARMAVTWLEAVRRET